MIGVAAHNHRQELTVSWCWPLASVERKIFGATADDDRALHAGCFVDVFFTEVFARLHVDKRFAGGVAHDRNSIPIFWAVCVADNVTCENDCGADARKNGRGVVSVVGFAARDRLRTRSCVVGVLGDLVILHEVDHIYRTIFGFGAGGEEEAVFFVDSAVVVFEIWFVAHDFAPCVLPASRRQCFALRFILTTSVVSAVPSPRVVEVSGGYVFWRQRSLQ